MSVITISTNNTTENPPDGSTVDVTGANDTVNLTGTGNAATTSQSTTITLVDDGQATLTGSTDTVTLGTGDTLIAVGGGNAITVTGGGSVTLSGTDGSADTVNVSFPFGDGGETITLGTDTQVTVTANLFGSTLLTGRVPKSNTVPVGFYTH